MFLLLIISEELKKQQPRSYGDVSVEVARAVESASDWWRTNLSLTRGTTEMPPTDAAEGDKATSSTVHHEDRSTSEEVDGGDVSRMNANSKYGEYHEESSHEHSHSLERRDSSVENLDDFDPSTFSPRASTREAWTSARSNEFTVMQVWHFSCNLYSVSFDSYSLRRDSKETFE